MTDVNLYLTKENKVAVLLQHKRTTMILREFDGSEEAHALATFVLKVIHETRMDTMKDCFDRIRQIGQKTE